jgi:hypothetical protein
VGGPPSGISPRWQGIGGARGPVSRILSPPREEGGGHFSGTGLAPGLERPTRKERCAGRRCPSLFGLSPGGVCRAGSVTESAVRSCRTVSPLPAGSRPKATPNIGGLFSVALSLASRPVAVDNHPDLWSPDFPPRSLPHGSARSGRPDLSRREHSTPSGSIAHLTPACPLRSPPLRCARIGWGPRGNERERAVRHLPGAPPVDPGR